jgi:hypothetical protein
MVTAAFEEERRRRAKALRDDLMAGASMISGGVAAFGAGQDKKKATDAAQANVDADNARADKAETRASDTAKAAAEDRATAAADRTAAANVLRKKGEAAEAAVLRKKQIDDAKAARDMLMERARGGASFESVRGAASQDAALGEWDDSNVQSLYDEVAREKAERAAAENKAKKKDAVDDSVIDRNTAAADKSRRGPVGPKAKTPEQIADEELRRRKLKADTEKAEAEAAQKAKGTGGDIGLNAPEKASINKAQERRRVLGEVKRINKTIRSLKDQYPDIESYVGPLDKMGGWLASKLGLSSQKAEEIKSTIRRAFDEYKNLITGAAASDKEMASLEDTVPNMGDSWAQILGKLDAGNAIADEKARGITAVLDTGDTRFYDPDYRAPATKKKAAPVPDDVAAEAEEAGVELE